MSSLLTYLLDLVTFCFVSVINFLIESIALVFNLLLGLLPNSPFLNVEGLLPQEYIGFLPWLVPVNMIVNTLGVWIGAVMLYYIIQVALRWFKMIE